MPKSTISELGICRDITYSLVYPGVLGSVVFDLLDPLRFTNGALPDDSIDLALFGARVFLGLIFVLDYINLRYFISPESKATPCMVVYDFAIAVTFTLTYFAIARASTHQCQIPRLEWIEFWGMWSLRLLLISFLLVATYPKSGHFQLSAYNSATKVPFCFVALLVVVACLAPPGRCMPFILLFAMFASSYLYGFPLYHIVESRAKASSNSDESGSTREVTGANVADRLE